MRPTRPQAQAPRAWPVGPTRWHHFPPQSAAGLVFFTLTSHSRVVNAAAVSPDPTPRTARVSGLARFPSECAEPRTAARDGQRRAPRCCTVSRIARASCSIAGVRGLPINPSCVLGDPGTGRETTPGGRRQIALTIARPTPSWTTWRVSGQPTASTPTSRRTPDTTAHRAGPPARDQAGHELTVDFVARCGDPVTT